MVSPDELWIVDFGEPYPGEPAHHRPALVVGPIGLFGPDFPFVFVIPLTTSARGLSLHVEVDPSSTSGLDAISYAQCELLRSVSSRRLVHRMGTINRQSSRQVETVVRSLLGY